MHPRLPASSPHLEPTVLTGRFVRLEPLHADHALQLEAAALEDARTWLYMSTRVSTAGDLRRWIEAALEQQATGRALPFAVVDLRRREAVGSTRLFDDRPHDRGIEIGHTWYAPSVWGTAVNPEAKLLLLGHAFDVLRCVRVQLKTDERNAQSRAAIAGLGARQEGILRKHLLVQGGVFRNSVYFSVLDDEWPGARAGLEARLHAFEAARSHGAPPSPPG